MTTLSLADQYATDLRDVDIPILVVDDIRDNLELMEALLLGEGFSNVLLAQRGQQALDILVQRSDIGVVLLDLMMPDMDGYEVCRRITTNPLTQHIPVLVVTGAAFRQNEALLKSFAAGAIDFLHKPLNEVELFARIRVALALFRERVLRQASLRTIAANETRFRTIINQAPVGIAQISRQGRFLMVNDYLCSLTGYRDEQLKTMSLTQLVMDADNVTPIHSLLTEHAGSFNLETRLQPQHGDLLWVMLSLTPLHTVEMANAEVIEDTFIVIIENTTERKTTADQMAYLAAYDTLTRLPNRTHFQERLRHAIYHAECTRQKLAVLFLDLDNFKTINDSWGHAAGDLLLKGFAERVQSGLRDNDLLSRFGGDEFTLLLPDINHIENAFKVAQKILNQVNRPFIIEDHEYYVGVSIGISLYPQDGKDVETLLKNADTAMYRAKEMGRRNYQLFNPALDSRIQQRLKLEQDLRRSLEQENFVLYYQPQVELKERRIIGVEALLRWQHPERGLLNPSQFLPLAEETGLIIYIGEWVIRQACLQAKSWYQQGHTDWVVYINLSRRQLQQVDVLNQLKMILDELQLPPRMLGIEIAENSQGTDTDSMITSIKNFHDLGIRIALDDFGYGYSSFNILKHLPLHTLKIDKTFIQDALNNPNDLAIVKAMIAIGQSFGLQVVAEGVESKALVDLVVAQGCHIAQGYFFGRPQPIERFATMFSGSTVTLSEPL